MKRKKLKSALPFRKNITKSYTESLPLHIGQDIDYHFIKLSKWQKILRCLRWWAFNMKTHTSYVCKQISKSFAIKFRSTYFWSSNTKLTLCYSLIYSCIFLSTSHWSSTCEQHRQNFLFTKTFWEDYREHTAPHIFLTGLLRNFPSQRIAKN